MKPERFIEAFNEFRIDWGLDLTMRYACHLYKYKCTVLNDVRGKIFNKNVSKDKKAEETKKMAAALLN